MLAGSAPGLSPCQARMMANPDKKRHGALTAVAKKEEPCVNE
jgi:hypothetical protein